MQQEHINPWKVIDSNEVYDNNWIKVTHHTVITPGGGNGIYGKVHFKNRAMGVVVIDNEMNTWLVGQYRFPTDMYSWEIPEGGGPLKEEPLDAAKRELLEETGLVAANWQYLLTMYLSNSVSDEKSIVYLATGLTQKQAQPEETEQLLLIKIPLTEAFAMVEEGKITDSISVAALQKVQLLLLQGKLKL